MFATSLDGLPTATRSPQPLRHTLGCVPGSGAPVPTWRFASLSALRAPVGAPLSRFKPRLPTPGTSNSRPPGHPPYEPNDSGEQRTERRMERHRMEKLRGVGHYDVDCRFAISSECVYHLVLCMRLRCCPTEGVLLGSEGPMSQYKAVMSTAANKSNANMHNNRTKTTESKFVPNAKDKRQR